MLKKVMLETFGDPTGYYRESLEKDAWSVQEAVFFITGKLPAPMLTAQEMCDQYPTEALLMHHVINGCLGESLKSRELAGVFYVTPKNFLKWIHSKGWEIHEVLMKIIEENGLILSKKNAINKNIVAIHKQQVLDLGKKIVIRIGGFNQKKIYDDPEMKALLASFVDCQGCKKDPYAEVTVKKWLSEIDERPVDKRRGRPKKALKSFSLKK